MDSKLDDVMRDPTLVDLMAIVDKDKRLKQEQKVAVLLLASIKAADVINLSAPGNQRGKIINRLTADYKRLLQLHLSAKRA